MLSHTLAFTLLWRGRVWVVLISAVVSIKFTTPIPEKSWISALIICPSRLFSSRTCEIFSGFPPFRCWPERRTGLAARSSGARSSPTRWQDWQREQIITSESSPSTTPAPELRAWLSPSPSRSHKVMFLFFSLNSEIYPLWIVFHDYYYLFNC